MKKPITPRSQIKNALRQIWLRSRERLQALKRTKYCCYVCGVKQSKAKGREVKIQVHHVNGIDWDGVVDLIIDRMLKGELRPLCKPCHDKEHVINISIKGHSRHDGKPCLGQVAFIVMKNK